MAIENRLGRGLDALLGAAPSAPATPVARPEHVPDSLPLDTIVPNSEQARKHFDEEKLAELAASIREQGILQPLMVTQCGENQYSIIAGERRWRAAKLAGLRDVPVKILKKERVDQQIISLIENLQREDLNPLEEANGIYALMENCGLTQDQVAQKLGKSRSNIANTVRLRSLSPDAQEDLLGNRITAGHARCLLALDSAEAQEQLRLRMHAVQMTVRDAENAVAHYKEHGIFPWDVVANADDAEPTPSDNQGKSRKKSGRDASLVAAARRIAATLNCKAKISGDQNRGKITLHYEDTETLEDLLASLGAGSLNDAAVTGTEE